MRRPSKNRAYQLAALGGVTALVSVMAYASQNLVDWNPLQRFREQPVLASTPRTDEARGVLQRRSALLRTGSNAQRRKARDLALEKSPQTERQIFGHHIQGKPLSVSQRMPLQMPMSHWVEATFDQSGARENLLSRPSFAARKGVLATAASCSSTQFTSLSGQALVDAVTSASTSCINGLFGLSGSDAANTFGEVKMATIANALEAVSVRYDGTNRDGALQLILFLRAGYYVQYYDPAVGNYGDTLRNAIRPALDAFSNNVNFGLVNDAHGEVLAEFVTLIDSSTENARYLPVVKRLLDSYDSSYDPYFWMVSAVNNAYTVLFRGHQNSDFKQLVQSDSSIIDTLYGFADRNFNKLGGSTDYLVSNAGREMGRFLQYTGPTKTLTQARVKALLDRSSVTGATAKLWMGLAEMVNQYDAANCSYYDLCDFKERVEAAVLPIHHTCSPTLTIRAQALTASELDETCSIVAGQETYFHDLMKTGKVPVANDNNAALEMVVFHSSQDYGSYAGALFGIDTNNGGMYLEGDPAAAGNQARFIAYQAEWLRPQRFEIWNLTHEYIHYLDGRFDMFGDFADSSSHAIIWWIEGFAEYMSYSYRKVDYTAAQQEAAKRTYNLSTIYANNYNSGQTRIYNWGYLAVRYMFERHPTQVNSILAYTRPGNYAGYDDFMRNIGTSNDAEFMAWLPCVAQPEGAGCSSPSNTPPVAAFSAVTDGLQVSFTDASTDVDGQVVSRVWNFGDGSAANTASPAHVYAAPGTYTVTLTVTDDRGATATISKQVSVTKPANKPPVAGFSVVVEGLQVKFSNSSMDRDGRIVSQSWDFGDRARSRSVNPTHRYRRAGSYTVRLTVRDNQGASTTIQRVVTVKRG